MEKRNVIFCVCFVLATGFLEQTFDGPKSHEEWKPWIETITKIRDESLASIHFNGSIFTFPELLWTQTSFIQPQSHSYDRFFYDRETGRYTVGRFLNDLQARFGGIDSVLLWHTYPNIGVDDRNQYDLDRLAPHGFADAVDELKAHGVKVLLPLNPWDSGTRPEGVDDVVAMARVVKEMHADGFNGDTMEFIPESYWLESLRQKWPLAIEPEIGGTLEMLNWSTLGWGYWDWRNNEYPRIPLVDKWKWFEPRRMTHLCNRWAKDRTEELQHAWFNGDGYESWENVWGTWNGFTDRDAELTRRFSAMSRFFGSRGFLVSKGWLPHSLSVIQVPDIFASMWPLPSGDVLWTLVNRGTADVKGAQIAVTWPAPGVRYFDCYNGVELVPEVLPPDHAALSFTVEARGIGCVLATKAPDTVLDTFLGSMAKMTKQPLSSFSAVWKYLPQQVVVTESKPVSKAPQGMLQIPAGEFHFQSTGVEIEGDDEHGVDCQMEWEDHPRRSHDRVLKMKSFFIGRFPVTNHEFRNYLRKSGFLPKDPRNFLKHWNGSDIPPGWENKPVTWVSRLEAEGFCKYFGWRLPREVEWAYAAQGTDGRLYPWGNSSDPSRYPTTAHGRIMPSPDSVFAHSPAGDSVFGIGDLVGNVWQWTDEYCDIHTCFAILRGGSRYRPQGSDWYFPQALELNKHQKYLLFDDAYDRSGAIGFRCVADAV